MRLRRFTPWILPLIALGAFGFAIASTAPKAAPEAPAPYAPPPEAPFAAQVAGIGITEPKSESIAVGTNLPGIVSRVAVSVGDTVKAGDVLFAIDARETEAALATARLEAANAEREFARYASVADARAVSEDERTRRRYAAEIARARVKELETTLQRLSVRAPISGTILRVNVRPGEYAAAGALPQPLLVMGDVSTMHVRVEVDEADALRVNPTAKAEGALRGYSAQKIPLTFVRKEFDVRPKRMLSGMGSDKVDTRVQEIVYAFDNASVGAFVGQQMDVFIEASR